MTFPFDCPDPNVAPSSPEAPAFDADLPTDDHAVRSWSTIQPTNRDEQWIRSLARAHLALIAENERLRETLESHAPEGHNATNAEFHAAWMRMKKAEAERDQAVRERDDQEKAANHWFTEANRDHNDLVRAEAKLSALAEIAGRVQHTCVNGYANCPACAFARLTSGGKQ